MHTNKLRRLRYMNIITDAAMRASGEEIKGTDMESSSGLAEAYTQANSTMIEDMERVACNMQMEVNMRDRGVTMHAQVAASSHGRMELESTKVTSLMTKCMEKVDLSGQAVLNIRDLGATTKRWAKGSCFTATRARTKVSGRTTCVTEKAL